jgi:hypothetical protein
MPFFVSFFCLVILGCAAVIGSRGSAILPDPFAEIGTARTANLDRLDVFDLAALKTRHAADVTSYAIGLFGSSRIVGVSEANLPGVVDGSVFNFAIPGSSFRDSVALVETLAANDSLPTTVIISLDNVALNHISEARYPGLVKRLKIASDDLVWLIERGKARLTLQSLKDHVVAEAAQLTRTFSFDHLAARLRLLSPTFGPNEGKASYGRDGSRLVTAEALGRNSDAPDPILKVSQPFVLWPDYLHRDLQRLAQIDSRDVKILIFESPLAPGTVLVGERSRLEHYRALRQSFVVWCGELNLTCTTSDAFEPFQYSGVWADESHAPAGELGRFLIALVSGEVAR